jgi:hypothetical protein
MEREELKNRIRSKATVEEGIVKRTEHNGIVYAEYEPGNGYRYYFLCTPCEGLEVSGAGSKHFMVSFLSPVSEGWKSYPFMGGEGNVVMPYYANGKMEIGNRVHACVFCEVLPHLIGTRALGLDHLLDYVEK